MQATFPAYEKLGAFYLGKLFDLSTRARQPQPLLYDSKDLVTHAVCVGMTGSGKTGLCIGLIEEAAIDGIPSIIIDPKGDISNLMLTFPTLSAQEFAPWINEDDARTKGLTPGEFAQQQASMWGKGLAEWGQDGARVQRLKDAADVTIYTPGSGAGVQVSVLKSFDCPGGEILGDVELFRERVAGTATGLLALVGAESEVNSREHTFLSTLFADAWTKRQNLDLSALIEAVQRPAFTKLGVMELESVFPAKDRFALAMQLNNLIAAPGFAAWTQGVALDLQRMLYGEGGKPRIAIFSISHLNDAERMFFVAHLLNHTLGWVRSQSGTGSLRAILYMDEIAGYFPPVANPPSKQPLLTLMKQARAFGVGCVLATQNPVDLDYKGLSNAGTWFIGRLQTQRDKDRVLDGLEGAAAGSAGGFDRESADKALSALGARVFLMNNVHDDGPVVFETRWCLSYLRGPLTRQQIRTLMESRRGGVVTPPLAGLTDNVAFQTNGQTNGQTNSQVDGRVDGLPATSMVQRAATTSVGTTSRPVLPPTIAQYFLPSRFSGMVIYEPRLLGIATVHYSHAKTGTEHSRTVNYLVSFADGVVTLDWDHARQTEYTQEDLERDPCTQGVFGAVPPELTSARAVESWKKQFANAAYRRESLTLLYSPLLDVVSKPGEAERDFRTRLAHAAREARDAAADGLRAKYAPKFATVQDRIRKARQTVEVQEDQAGVVQTSTFMSVGSAILGAFLGRKIMTAGTASRAAAAAKGLRRRSKEAGDVARAQANVEVLMQQQAELEARFQEELETMTAQSDAATQELETIIVRPKKANVVVKAVVLAWEPRLR